MCTGSLWEVSRPDRVSEQRRLFNCLRSLPLWFPLERKEKRRRIVPCCTTSPGRTPSRLMAKAPRSSRCRCGGRLRLTSETSPFRLIQGDRADEFVASFISNTSSTLCNTGVSSETRPLNPRKASKFNRSSNVSAARNLIHLSRTYVRALHR